MLYVFQQNWLIECGSLLRSCWDIAFAFYQTFVETNAKLKPFSEHLVALPTKAPGSPHISRSPSGQGPLSEFMGIFKEKLQCKHRSSNWYQSKLGNFYIEEMQKVCVDITCFLTKLMSLFLHTWTATSEFGTYRLCEQRRFRRACASAQSRQNLRCSLI